MPVINTLDWWEARGAIVEVARTVHGSVDGTVHGTVLSSAVCRRDGDSDRI